jgi:two-component SAPR family response regulator
LEHFESVAGEFDDIELCGLFDDADDLIACIGGNPPDAVFLDIEMPGKSGMQLAEELHAIDPNLSIVFVTAFSQYAVEAFELSVSDYLIKPISKERLRKTLDRIAGRRQLLQNPEKRVTIHCFRRFELQIDGRVAPLSHLMKAKELLAFLVSREGAETSWEQITEALWPEADYERAHNNLYVTTYRLRKWLEENDITRIFESRRNSYRVVPTEFNCDLFDFEKALKDGNGKRMRELYKGDFLEEEAYGWAYPIQAVWAGKLKHK